MPGGAEPGDHLGEALTVGNFNGDSRADLAIGLPFNGDGNGDVGDQGGIIVLYGSSSLLASSGAVFIGQGSGGIPDAQELEDRFGSALASADFDGDGYGDLAIGAAEEDFSGTDAGVVIVSPGSPSGLLQSSTQLLSQDFPGVFEDTDSGDELGRVLRARGERRSPTRFRPPGPERRSRARSAAGPDGRVGSRCSRRSR